MFFEPKVVKLDVEELQEKVVQLQAVLDDLRYAKQPVQQTVQQVRSLPNWKSWGKKVDAFFPIVLNVAVDC